MFEFEKDKKEELLKGRTITYIANEVGISKEFLTSILNGKRNCSKLVAYSIVKACNSDSEISDYFIQKRGE